MKKIFYLVLTIVALLLLAIWSPWYSWNISIYSLFGIESPEKYAGLRVKSMSGEIDIYIDDELQGFVTDNEDFADIFSIKPGTHSIKLIRKDFDNFYTFEREVKFDEGIEVVLAYDLGPNMNFTEGHLFYTKKNYLSDSKPKLNIYSVPDMTKVYLDDILIGESPLEGIELDISRQHKVTLEKTGYETLEFTILPDTNDDRQKLLGYDLIIEAKLFLKPVKLIER